MKLISHYQKDVWESYGDKDQIRESVDQAVERIEAICRPLILLESKSCGAIMRVAPIGLYYHSDPSELRLAAWASSVATHAHPTALVSAEVTAFCVAWAVAGVAPCEYWDRIKALQTDSVQAWEPVLGKSWQRAGYVSSKDYLMQTDAPVKAVGH